MASEIELALMAGRAYFDTRDDINHFPVPDGWAEKKHESEPSGFEAVSFQRSNEIVISYAGTDDKDYFGDILTGINLASGYGYVDQLWEAAEYYLQVKRDNPDPNVTITLTGHSLGGGLAALIGVFFGVKAVTFDQAPFGNAAGPKYDPETMAPNDAATVLLGHLQGKGIYTTEELSGLTSYIQERQASGGIPNTELISNIRVDGEFLSSTFPFSEYSTIGTIPPANVLAHGPTDISGGDLHSMALLTAFLQSDQSEAASGQTLRAATSKLTDLLGMIFNKQLFANETDPTNTTKVNFLEHLAQHQEGLDPAVPNDGDAMVSRFTSDLWKIAQDGGLTMANNDLTKALTAFAMQAYYFNRPESDATLFDAETGGIHFDRMDVADTLDAAKGYTMYFTNYLNTLPANERSLIVAQLPNLLDWYIQAGNQTMEATAGTQRAFMLGGSGDDVLTGGSQADVLVGNGGADTLDGGTDADLMIGGYGIDTYYIDGNDTIQDTGENFIYFKDASDKYQLLAGGFVREEGTNTYRFLGNENITLTFHSPGHMVLNGTDSITFENQTSAADFENGDFGITLYGPEDTDRRVTGTEGDDEVFVYLDNGVAHYALLQGDISGPNVQYTAFIKDNKTYWCPMFSYSFYVTPPNLYIEGGGGNDNLYGLAGADIIKGGEGNDNIYGDPHVYFLDQRLSPWGDADAADFLDGGVGNDFIWGAAGDDFIYGGDGQDCLMGEGGDDFLDGGEDNDWNLRMAA